MRSASTEGRGDWAFKSGSIVDRETYTKFMELELEKVRYRPFFSPLGETIFIWSIYCSFNKFYIW